MTKPYKLGVAIPTYKESLTVGPLIQAINKAVPGCQIAVVDDSPDLATVQAAESLKLANVAVVHRDNKDGRGSAVIEAFKILQTKGCDLFLEMDSDFSHPPEQIPELVEDLQTRGLDVLIASRYIAGSRIENWPASRRVFSWGANILARATLQIPVHDYTGGFRLYTARAADIVVSTCGRQGKGFIVLSEILVNLHYRGFKIGEMSTIFKNRERGSSSLGYDEVKNAVVGLVKIAKLKQQLKREAGL